MAARLGLLFLLLVVAVWISQAGPVPGQSVNPRVGNVLQNSGQTKSSVNPQTADLSGTYIGVLDYPKAGLMGVAQLTIAGNTFTLTIESQTLSGHINSIAAGDYAKVIMLFEPPAAGSAPASISLTAIKSGGRLWLASNPGEDTYFQFDRPTPRRRHMRRARRGPASVDSNSANVSTANVNTNGGAPKNSNSSRPVGAARRARATGTNNARALSPELSTANSNVNANTGSTAGVSSQIRGNANVAFTTPETMQFTEVKDIELRVSPSESSAALASSLSEPGTSGTGSTEFADRMEAQLVGSGFTITSACPDIQPVEAGRTTWWKWQIKPKEAGPQRLDLTLNAVLNNGKDKSMLQTFHRDIRIEVTWRQRASSVIAGLKDVQWLWAAVILPIAAAIYGWWRKKKGHEDAEG